MTDLLFLRISSAGPGDTEAAHAPELRYLASHCLLQARQAFADGEVIAANAANIANIANAANIEEGGASPEPGRRFEAVLILGSDNVLIARDSLRALRARLRAGAAEVRPYRIADVPFGAAAAPPVYTLRGYERLERAFLAGAAGADPSSPLPPVALLSFERFERLREAGLLERFLAEPTEPEPPPGGIERAGVCHEFIDYYGEARTDILGFIPEGASEVLEVGCGRGVTGRLLQERLGCRVTGVELNPVVAEAASRHLHRVIQGDVQTLEIEGGYDVVLGLEVVEHLVETESFLARLKSLLAPGGRAILSIPNVGHYSVVEDLIAGRWDYLPIGLLCYTHYRFFTRRTLEDWLRRSGIERFEIVPQKTEAPERLEAFQASFDCDPESLSTKGFYVLIHG